jgi:uncharacterized protein YjbJ (UPF0337 family)
MRWRDAGTTTETTAATLRDSSVAEDGGTKMSARHDQFAGKAKELQGKVTGDQDKEAEGKAQHAQGDVEKAVGDAVHSVKSAGKAVGDQLSGG